MLSSPHFRKEGAEAQEDKEPIPGHTVLSEARRGVLPPRMRLEGLYSKGLHLEGRPGLGTNEDEVRDVATGGQCINTKRKGGPLPSPQPLKASKGSF